MKKIKLLKDDAYFYMGKYGRVVWRVIRHDPKEKKTVIQSTKTKTSRKVKWTLLVGEIELEP